MLSIDDLMQIERPTTTVKVGGTEITLRALLAAERRAIDTAWPPPAPRMIKNLNTGEETPNERSPAHQMEQAERWHALDCAVVAISMDHTIGGAAFPFGGKPEVRKAWIEAACGELGRIFTAESLVAMGRRIRELEQSQFDAAARIGTEKQPGN